MWPSLKCRETAFRGNVVRLGTTRRHHDWNMALADGDLNREEGRLSFLILSTAYSLSRFSGLGVYDLFSRAGGKPPARPSIPIIRRAAERQHPAVPVRSQDSLPSADTSRSVTHA